MESTGPYADQAPSASPARSAESAPAARHLPSWMRGLLSVPLVLKLIGANALVVAFTLAVVFATHTGDPQSGRMALILTGALLAAFAINLALVYVALKPLTTLEMTAERVWRGEFSARVPPSSLADRDIERIGSTLNTLLDSLTADRERARELAFEIIRTGDRERARIARELHDSTAQMLAAITLELSAASRETKDVVLSERLNAIRSIASDVLEEVRALSLTVHSSVLDDLGLTAALRQLAREAQSRNGMVRVALHAEDHVQLLAPEMASVLFRVAQEGVHNALRHGAPSSIDILLVVDEHAARLEVSDDGRGCDLIAVSRDPQYRGLRALRERVSLVEGKFEVTSHPGSGTRLRATVPLSSATRT